MAATTVMKSYFKCMMLPALGFFAMVGGGMMGADKKDEDLKVAVPASDKLAIDADWNIIKVNPKWSNKEVVIDGFLSIEGIGEFPRITLWETEECMRHKRVFSNIIVDSPSAMDVIDVKLDRVPDSWGVLHGAFVKITGYFEREDEGLEYICIGKLSKIREISVYSNGQVLYSLVK